MSVGDECTRCQAPLHTLAAFCKKCGQVVERQPLRAVPNGLQRVADRQRDLIRIFAVFLIVQALVFCPDWHSDIVFGTSVLCSYVISLGLLMGCVAGLATALEFGATARLMLTLVCAVPVINLIAIAWLIRQATGYLRDAGIRVGFLGAARKGDVVLLASGNRCRICGYDLRGLTSQRCPECGVAFTPLVGLSTQ